MVDRSSIRRELGQDLLVAERAALAKRLPGSTPGTHGARQAAPALEPDAAGLPEGDIRAGGYVQHDAPF